MKLTFELNREKSGAVNGFTVECNVHFKKGRRGRKRMQVGEAPPQPTVEPGKIPRISRLMALAMRFEELVRSGKAKDYADLARLGYVTRARMTMIMNLLLLAPDIQEEILFLPRIVKGRDPITERKIRHITATPHWHTQRRLWRDLLGKASQE